MDRNALLELEVLKHVEKTPRLNNRMAANKLGVSVKLAHVILNKMVTKGLLHVKKQHSRRWDYFLTPQGLSEKSRLMYEFLEFSFQFYREARRRSAQLCRDLMESGVTRIAFLGAGEMAEIVYLGVVEWKLQLVEVYDEGRTEKNFMGLPIQPLGELATSNVERIVVCLYDNKHPMTANFLPEAVIRDPRMVWVFGVEKTPDTSAGTPS